MTVITVPYHLDEPLPDLQPPLPADRTVAVDLPPGPPWERMAVLYEEVAGVVEAEVREGRVPVVQSGDCTTSLGVVAGLQRAGLDPRLVWFDGHADVQTPETSTSGYLGGFPLRQLAGGADRTAPDRLGLRAVAERDAVLVEARDQDPPEVEFLARSAIRCVPVAGLGGVLPSAPVYLHVDLDVVNPDDLPGLMFPAAGGPTVAELAAAVGAVLDTGRVAAVGIGCTYGPGSGAHLRLGELVARLSALE